MRQENLTELSIDELKQKEKILKIVLGLFIGVLILLIGVVIFLLINNGLTPMTMIAVPIVLFPILLYEKKKLKDLRTEIKSRQ